MQEQLSRLCALVQRHAAPNGRTDIFPGVFPGVVLFVARSVSEPMAGVYQPMLCLVLQGAKQVQIGDRSLRYDPASYFIASLDVPASGQVIEASEERPYVCASLALNAGTLATLIPEVPALPEPQIASFGVSPVTPQLLEPWGRLLSLLDTPEDAAVLAPLLEREILYRLLRGPQGGTLRQIAREDSRLSQIRQAIAWIRTHFDEPLSVEALAQIAGMSPATFHRHFKAATAMSPLQYQKRLRLQEARRLLVLNPDSARAAYTVGYESASQFSREYGRLFGVPPSRDASRLRGEGLGVEDISSAA